MGVVDLLSRACRWRVPRWVSACLAGVLLLGVLGVGIVALKDLMAAKEGFARRRAERTVGMQALRQAKAGFEEIAAAQEKYRAEKGQYASARELVQSRTLDEHWAKLLTRDDLVFGLYAYRILVPSAADEAAKYWCCYADVVRSSSTPVWVPRKSLFADYTGVVLVQEYATPRRSAYRAGSWAEPAFESGHDLGHWYEWKGLERTYLKAF